MTKQKFIVIEAKTHKEAIKVALEKLHASEHDVEITILREEHKGLFGMEGAQTAKIKVSLKKKTSTTKLSNSPHIENK